MGDPIDWRAAPASAPLAGELRVPSDKSITHRAVMLGSLAKGVTSIHNPLLGADARATMAAMTALGASVKESGDVVKVTGAGELASPAGPIDCGNAGTLIRLLAGAVCGRGISCVLDGDESLRRRPMRRITDPLARMGADIATADDGTPPLRIGKVDRLAHIEYELPKASAQIKSAVLLAGLCADGGATVIEPQPCRNHTELMLPSFGASVEVDGPRIHVAPGPLTAATVKVPADISSAAFFLVAASIVPGSDILLRDVGVNPTRTGIIHLLLRMGADIEMLDTRKWGSEPVADIRVRHAILRNIDIGARDVPGAIDELPVLFVAASCAQGTMRLRGAAELRAKESDRLAAMAAALGALGAQVVEYDDGLDVTGGELAGGEVDSQGDHRIAMAMAAAALRSADEVRIGDCANVATSFPGFIEQAAGLGWPLGVA